MKENMIPVMEGQEILAECESVGSKGDGIFKFKGYIIMVPDTQVGETYTIKVTKALSKFGFGEVV